METKGKGSAKGPRKTTPLVGSVEARRLAAGVLEVMSGERGPAEVSEALGISSMRYYALEERALRGMVEALEPRPRGRRAVSPEDALAKAVRERDVLRRELSRTQALLRLVRKSVHIETKGKAKRKPRKTNGGRTTKLLARLKEPAAPSPVPETVEE